MTVVLGTHIEYVGLGRKGRLVETKDTFQYVPLLNGLQSLLLNDVVRHEVSNSSYMPLVLQVNFVFMCRYYHHMLELTAF